MGNTRDSISPPNQTSTVQSELEGTFKLLGLIEDKIFFPNPEQCKESPVSGNKITATREDVALINERLSRINEALNFIGK
jgi:hypothetical protein